MNYRLGITLKKKFTFLYYFAFTLYCFIYWLNTTTFNELSWVNTTTLYVYIRVFCVVVLFVEVLLAGLSFKQYLVYSILFIIFLISSITSGSWNIFLLFLFILAGSKIEVKKLAKIVLFVTLFITSAATICSILGLINMRTIPSGSSFRLAYGFIHPNQYGLSVLTMVISVAILRFRKFHFPEISFGLICFSLAYFLVVSRTASICILITIILSIVCTADRKKKLDSTILHCGTVLFGFFQVASLYLMVFYDSSKQWMSNLDRFLSCRLDLMNHFYKTYPHGIWGHNFDSIENVWYKYFQGFIVDNGFAHAVLESGIIVELIVFVCWFAYLCVACKKKILDPSSFGLIIYGFVAFTEASSFFIVVNFCLVSLSMLTNNKRG